MSKYLTHQLSSGQRSHFTRLIVAAYVALAIVTTDTGTTMAAQGDCGQPVSDGGAPSASDALFVLRVAVGLDACATCVCDVDASGLTSAGDALSVLTKAVGGSVTFSCVSCGFDGNPVLYGVGFLPAGDGTLYRIENYATDPTADPIGGGNLSLIGDLAIDPTNGDGYAIATTGSLFRIDLTTGALISSVAGAGANPNALTFSSDGALYSWGGRPQQPGMDTNLYVLDKAQGGGQIVVDTGHVAAGDLAYDSQTDALYGSTSAGLLIRINLAPPTVTTVGTLLGATHTVNVLGLDIDPTDGSMYALVGGTLSTAATLYSVDKATAAMTLIGDVEGAHGIFGAWGLAFGPISQP